MSEETLNQEIQYIEEIEADSDSENQGGEEDVAIGEVTEEEDNEDE